MKRKKLLFSLVAFVFSLLFFATPVLAQTSYQLNVHKNNGFNNGSQIRGSFTISVIPEDNIQSVTFLIDQQEMKVISASPFSFNFNTTDYATGSHTLSATIQTLDGKTVDTPVETFEFVTAEQETAFMKDIFVPILGSIALIVVIVIGSQFLLPRNKALSTLPLGATRNYGLLGGAICPKCHRPFPLSLLRINLGFNSTITRCPFCGKWGVVHRYSLGDLRAAEAAELADAQPDHPIQEKTEEEKLREKLDESRYTDR
jgi:hypothetical protein